MDSKKVKHTALSFFLLLCNGPSLAGLVLCGCVGRLPFCVRLVSPGEKDGWLDSTDAGTMDETKPAVCSLE